MRHTTALALATLIAVPLVSADAAAETIRRFVVQNATGFCQAALPVFDGQIRKRPTAVANEGTSNAFVSCSMQGNPVDDNHLIDDIAIVLYNRGAGDISVTCNLIDGFQAGATLHPKTLVVPAGAREFFVWTPSEIGRTEIDFPNFNCNLPVGVEIGYGYYYQTYEIGS